MEHWNNKAHFPMSARQTPLYKLFEYIADRGKYYVDEPQNSNVDIICRSSFEAELLSELIDSITPEQEAIINKFLEETSDESLVVVDDMRYKLNW